MRLTTTIGFTKNLPKMLEKVLSLDGTFFLYKENHRPVVPKSFSYAQSRRSGKPPSDEGGGFAAGEDGGRETSRENSLPQSRCSRDSPLIRGGLRFANNRICGGKAEHASERKFDEPIGSVSNRP